MVSLLLFFSVAFPRLSFLGRGKKSRPTNASLLSHALTTFRSSSLPISPSTAAGPSKLNLPSHPLPTGPAPTMRQRIQIIANARNERLSFQTLVDPSSNLYLSSARVGNVTAGGRGGGPGSAEEAACQDMWDSGELRPNRPPKRPRGEASGRGRGGSSEGRGRGRGRGVLKRARGGGKSKGG